MADASKPARHQVETHFTFGDSSADAQLQSALRQFLEAPGVQSGHGIQVRFHVEEPATRATDLRRELTAIMELKQKGDFLGAYDRAMEAHKRFPSSIPLKYHAVLALIRAGLIDKAADLCNHPDWDLEKTDPFDVMSMAGGLAAHWTAKADREEEERVAQMSKNARATLQTARDSRGSISWVKRVESRFADAFEYLATVYARLNREIALKHATVVLSDKEIETLFGESKTNKESDVEEKEQLDDDNSLTTPTNFDAKRYAKKSASLFAKEYEESGGTESGVSAAAMFYIAGDANTAESLIQRVHKSYKTADTKGISPHVDRSRYPEKLYLDAMHILIAGNPIKLPGAIHKLVKVFPKRLEKSGLMWRQLAAVLVQRIRNSSGRTRIAREDALAEPPPATIQIWIDCQMALVAPTIMHYGGHMLTAVGSDKKGFCEDHVIPTKAKLQETLKTLRVGAGYGSLACGADILFAECLLEAGAELHVVLPFRKDDFVDTSVRRAGPDWIERFNRCLERANTVSFATYDESLGDSSLFGLGADVAMGMALRRAETTGLRAVQCLVLREKKKDVKNSPVAGTVSLANRWCGIPESVKNPRHGTRLDRSDLEKSQVLLPPIYLAPAQDEKPRPTASPSTNLTTDGPGQGTGRQARALLFGDIKGYSKLSEELVPKCVELVMGGLRDVITTMTREFKERKQNAQKDIETALKSKKATQTSIRKAIKAVDSDPRYLPPIESWNTWGDAVYVVARTAEIGAECAMRMRKFIKKQDFERHGLPKDMTMRFGMHYGPVYPTNDPVHGKPTWFGSHVSKAARIEPVTDEGEVFVSEPFACVLAVEASDKFACDYIGCVASAKGYGAFRMFKLRRRSDEEQTRLEEPKSDETEGRDGNTDTPQA
jgi:class 3 adenylate cyclase